MEAVTREDLDAIRNHISNIPSVGAMYAPALVEWAAALLRQRDELRAQLAAELPAMWREDIASFEAIVERLSKERDSLKEQLDIAHKFHDVAVKERDFERVRSAHAQADAEQAIHNEAFMERRKIAEWLRTASRASGVLISIHSSQDLARCADAIERGEHAK